MYQIQTFQKLSIVDFLSDFKDLMKLTVTLLQVERLDEQIFKRLENIHQLFSIQIH